MKTLTGLAALAAVLALLAAAGCAAERGAPGLYHCPMHPTYTSDRPADCPICGMRLVPVEPRKAASPGAEPSPLPGGGDYHCPMCPEVHSAHPGRCPTCGMNLKLREPAPEHAEVHRAPAEIAAAGIRTWTVAWGSLERELRASGTVEADESRIHHLHTKVSGWVERLHVNVTGQEVKTGQPLLEIYSPELLAGQEEYLRARELERRLQESAHPEARRSVAGLAAAARRRLELFDAPPDLLAALDSGASPRRLVTLESPSGGFVRGKEVFSGHRVEPGMVLMEVVDLSSVWILARFYEKDLPGLKVGQVAEIRLPGGSGPGQTGRVIFLDPFLDPETRTVTARLSLKNPDLVWRPGMYAEVTLRTEAVSGVLAPDQAILETGKRSLVFVEREPGRFEPREVVVRAREGGTAVVASGLAAGERVALGANFLLDSESRLAAALSPAPAGGK